MAYFVGTVERRHYEDTMAEQRALCLLERIGFENYKRGSTNQTCQVNALIDIRCTLKVLLGQSVKNTFCHVTLPLYVYDYMFHLLNSYAKLFRYKPSISANATELCVESMVCGAEGSVKKFMMESLVKVPANTDPCTMPAPFDPPTLYATLQRKEISIQQVESWEKSYWDNQTITS
ncbi:hypothetical protein D0Y65_044161 [Glycine soja]|uniref:Glycosyl transferase CAP10 domain-containing protein n=1 Tax=Glycine soja TaxID=3848 RepID=A0A445GKH2_GLYSO|nr:hypothetical protein D0Y65_044161 [Glycine soja]